MQKYQVNYCAGTSRYGFGDVFCDYMITNVPDPNDNEECIELYAEANPLDYGAVMGEDGELIWDETETYEPLKKMILEQAHEYGIDPDSLVFFYDDLDEWAKAQYLMP